MNRFFGARRAVNGLFRVLARSRKNIVLIDLASGYGDHGRNIIDKARARQQSVTVIAVDQQLQTLRISRRAATPERKFHFVQADARHLPFRSHSADLVFCSLALHHFKKQDAVRVLEEMARVGRFGMACVDLVRSRLAALAIWLLTALVYREPMARHDARLSIRRAFTVSEMEDLARRARWPQFQHPKFLLFQQGIYCEMAAPEVNGSAS